MGPVFVFNWDTSIGVHPCASGRSLEGEIRFILADAARHEDADKVWAAIEEFGPSSSDRTGALPIAPRSCVRTARGERVRGRRERRGEMVVPRSASRSGVALARPPRTTCTHRNCSTLKSPAWCASASAATRSVHQTAIASSRYLSVFPFGAIRIAISCARRLLSRRRPVNRCTIASTSHSR